MENDINTSAARPETERSDAERSATDRPKEYFSVRLTLSGAAQEFEDPRQAGEAFFRADPTERPSVAHIDGNTARTMARTEIHGVHETGETRYFKSLPDSHTPDAEFRAGFLNAMEASLTERLGKVEWGKDGPAMTERLDTGLRDDLEAFARRAPERQRLYGPITVTLSRPGRHCARRCNPAKQPRIVTLLPTRTPLPKSHPSSPPATGSRLMQMSS